MKPLNAKTAMVTGASRGIGKGVALALSKAGATVYITGRTQKDTPGVQGLEGSIQETVDAITAMGGKGFAIHCDHTNDSNVEAAFKIFNDHEQGLDILVNNVWGGYECMFNEKGEYIWEHPFWQQPLKQWDLMFNAGVRAHYIASCFAAPMMIKQKSGLIVNISQWAAQKYIGNVCYGMSKATTDKLTFDTGYELLSHNIAVVSLYPGLVRTERVMKAANYLDLSNSESPEYIGQVITSLYTDPDRMKHTGKSLVAAQLGKEYGILDIDGKIPEPLTLDNI